MIDGGKYVSNKNIKNNNRSISPFRKTAIWYLSIYILNKFYKIKIYMLLYVFKYFNIF
jgi:hypothetical protein